MAEGAVIDWLMEGDPVIRWQVQRDLLDEPKIGLGEGAAEDDLDRAGARSSSRR